MELSLLQMLYGQGGIVAAIISWLAVVYITATMIIAMTPTKKDDDFLTKVLGIPLVGGLLKALVEFGPKKK